MADRYDEIRKRRVETDLRDKALQLKRAMWEAREERDAALAAMERVRKLHILRTDDGFCDSCGRCYPCETIKALDGGDSHV